MTDTYTAAQRAARFGPDNQFAPTVGGTAKLPMAPVRMGGLVLDFESIASGATYPFKLFTNRNARLGLLTDLYHGNLASFVPDCGVYVNLFRRLSQAIAELLMLEPPLPQGFAASDELFLDRFQGAVYDVIINATAFGKGLLLATTDDDGLPNLISLDPAAWYPAIRGDQSGHVLVDLRGYG